MNGNTVTRRVHLRFSVKVLPLMEAIPDGAFRQNEEIDLDELRGLVFDFPGGDRDVYVLDNEARKGIREAISEGLLVPDYVIK